MSPTAELYDALAGLLAYPRGRFAQCIERCRAALGDGCPEAVAHLDRFGSACLPLSPEQLEELYTQTFDLSPVCSLELGWHLFGENYSRGEFLVQMRQLLRRVGLSESSELPDHLTHVLPVLGRLPPGEADRLISKFLLPALAKMREGLRGSIYGDVLEAIRAVVESPCGVAVEA